MIRNATSDEYQENPLRAAGKDFIHLVAEFTGLNAVDDASAGIRQDIDNHASAGTVATDAVLGAAIIGFSTAGEGPGEGPVEIHIDPEAHPQAAAHAENAMSNGVSGEGVIDRAGKDQRRQDNLKGVELETEKTEMNFLQL